ncbi:MAG: TetR family transcriptional regulator [Nitrincola lacisaponensis]|uniref:TetR family transcriptional regulator n=1 Tax=Nitrincola lacisaponensis TaxID=267850 RepID=UPI003918AA34
MPRRTKEEAAQTRAVLLSTAMRLYAERGVNAVSLKEIAAACGVTHGALYWHFRNRDDLLQQLYLVANHPFELQYIEQRQSAKQDPLQALQDYLLGVVRVFVQHPEACQAYRLFFASAVPVELATLQPQIEEDLQQIVEHIHYFLKQAKKKKQLRKKLPLNSTSEVLAGVLHSLVQSVVRMPPQQASIEAAQLLSGILLDGLRA